MAKFNSKKITDGHSFINCIVINTTKYITLYRTYKSYAENK